MGFEEFFFFFAIVKRETRVSFHGAVRASARGRSATGLSEKMNAIRDRFVNSHMFPIVTRNYLTIAI
jgi:hypothetical protein